MNATPIPDSPELSEAEEELARAIEAILKSAEAGPVIASVHSAGYCEDGKTLSVYCDAPDGSTIVWTFVPGQSVTPVVFP